MNWQLLWFVLAGLVLGFALSTLWEWFYFRRERMIVRDERISELEAQLRASEQREREQLMAAPPWTAPGYQSPSAMLESEQAEELVVSVGEADFVESSEPMAQRQVADEEADAVERPTDDAILAGAAIAASAADYDGVDRPVSDDKLPDESVVPDASDSLQSETPTGDDEEDLGIADKILPAAAVAGVGLAAVAMATGGSDEEPDEESADGAADDSTEDVGDIPVGAGEERPDDVLLSDEASEGEGAPEVEPGEESAIDAIASDVQDDAPDDVQSETPADEEEDSGIADKVLPAAAVAGAGLAALGMAAGGLDDEPDEVSADEGVPEVEPGEEFADDAIPSDAQDDVPDDVQSETPADEEEDSGIADKILPAAAVAGVGLAALGMAAGGLDDEPDEESVAGAADDSTEDVGEILVDAGEEIPADVLLSDEVSEAEGVPEVEPGEEFADDTIPSDAQDDVPDDVQSETPAGEEEGSGIADKVLPAAAVAGVGLAALGMAAGGLDDEAEAEEETADEPVDIPADAPVVAEEEMLEGGPSDTLVTEDLAAGAESEPMDGSEDPADEPDIWKPEEIQGYPDNLSRVKGVGKVYRRRLYDAGIFTWDQLSQMSVDEINEIAHPFVSADVEKWPERARRMAERNKRVGARYVGPTPDDLTEIRGIGANTMQRLYLGGIWSFSQLATSSPEELKEIIPTSPSGENINYEAWIEAATALAQEPD